MQTHEDSDFDREQQEKWLRELEEKAKKMTDEGASEITAAPALLEWKHGRVTVRQLPDDEHGILRISIGGGDTPLGEDYCTFRGDREQIVALLNRAHGALVNAPA